MRRLLLVLILAAWSSCFAAAGASASVSIPASPLASNPAERLLAVPIEPSLYEPATRCLPKASRPGTERLAAWLAANVSGVFWGSYRCELWGAGRASLHAEKRAIDWHLDASRRADRRAAERLISLLTAPDSLGNPHALARRMGVEEIIWDCGYWSAGSPAFRLYSPCADRRGGLRSRVDATIAHRDHIHIGLTRDGALGRTSFWTQPPASSGRGAAAPPTRRKRAGAVRRSGSRRAVPDRPPAGAGVAPAEGGGAQAPAGLR